MPHCLHITTPRSVNNTPDARPASAEDELAAASSRAAAVAAGAADDAYDSDDGGDEARDADDMAADDSDSADEEAAVATARAAAAHLSVDASVEAALAELNMDAYDEEDEHVQTARLFGGSGPLTYYASNAEDPYITLPDDDDDSDDRSSEFNLRDTGASAATCGLMMLTRRVGP